MASKNKGGLPDYGEKQKILYVRETAPEILLELADRLLEEDRFSEAYDFLERAGDEKRLEQYMHKALDRGDFFNFERAALWLDLEIPPTMWEQLAEAAARNEMFIYAAEAYRRAGKRQKADDIIQSYPDFFAPVLRMDMLKTPQAGKFEEPDEAALPETAQDAGAEHGQMSSPDAKKKKKKRKRR